MNGRPLSALLSQTLVAFTLELDNEFERRIAEAGYPSGRLSLVVWANLMRFLADGPLSIRDLARRSLLAEAGVKSQVGSLERWGLIAFPDSGDSHAAPPRDGWGSGRGIRAVWMVHPTAKGRAACEIWRTLDTEIERRWLTRFGDERIGNLRRTLESIEEKLDLELPQGVPLDLLGTPAYPPRRSQPERNLPLPALLSQLLLAFASEFDRQSAAPLRLCSNTLRVLQETPIPEADLPRLTGCSPETCGIGWQLKRYVTAASDPAAKRRRMVWLNAPGIEAQRGYQELTGAIENRWRKRFGAKTVKGLRASLEELFLARRGGELAMVECLTPSEGTVRSGVVAPALGRRRVAAAARQRMRDLVAQTRCFLANPAEALPHYPMWDHNRGFGP